MSIPETTSAGAFERYVGGMCLFQSRGEAWRDVKAWIVVLPPVGNTLPLPSVSEPFIAWTMSGEVEFQEREYKRPWITHRIERGSFFLTSGGAPYDVPWKALTSGPFEAMFVFVELPLLQRALEEVFGADADRAKLRDISAFTDVDLDSLMERLRDELTRPPASPLFVQGIAQAIAIHLARNYGVTVEESSRAPVKYSFKGGNIIRINDICIGGDPIMRPSTWQPPIETSAAEDQIIKRAKLFIFLRRHRHQIFTPEFQVELAGIYKDSPQGQPPVEPAMLAVALILQAYTGVSDDEVIEATLMDRRWQLALDCLGAQEPPFSKGTFVAFRTRLIEHQMDRRLLERTIEIAAASKAFGARNLRAALDSSPLRGRRSRGRHLQFVGARPAEGFGRDRARAGAPHSRQ